MRAGLFRAGRKALCASLLLFSAGALAAAETRTERVQFAPEASHAVVETSIRGHEVVDYLLAAKAGQYLKVSLASRYGNTSFDLLAPGETGFAMFNGAMNQNHFSGTLPATGDYRIRIYMKQAAARRDEAANVRVDISLR